MENEFIYLFSSYPWKSLGEKKKPHEVEKIYRFPDNARRFWTVSVFKSTLVFVMIYRASHILVFCSRQSRPEFFSILLLNGPPLLQQILRLFFFLPGKKGNDYSNFLKNKVINYRTEQTVDGKWRYSYEKPKRLIPKQCSGDLFYI